MHYAYVLAAVPIRPGRRRPLTAPARHNPAAAPPLWNTTLLTPFHWTPRTTRHNHSTLEPPRTPHHVPSTQPSLLTQPQTRPPCTQAPAYRTTKRPALPTENPGRPRCTPAPPARQTGQTSSTQALSTQNQAPQPPAYRTNRASSSCRGTWGPVPVGLGSSGAPSDRTGSFRRPSLYSWTPAGWVGWVGGWQEALEQAWEEEWEEARELGARPAVG